MTEEREQGKKVIGGSGITAGGNVSISGGSGQVAIGENITQTQISQTDLKNLLDSLLEFQKGVPELDLSPEDHSIVNGEIGAAIKEAKKDKPVLSKIKERFVSVISTVKEAGKSIKDISELYEAAKKIAPILGVGLQALL
jgi:chaperonin cofactor prefoldin